MEAHTAHTKLSLDLDKMLVEKKIELDGRERDLGLREAVLIEAQSQGLNPWDDHEELMEFIKVWKLLHYAKVERIAKAGQLARDVLKVLVDLGMPPILGIPQDPHITGDVLEAVGIFSEHLRESYASGHGPLD
jgi:hypothetical protein